MFIPFNYHIIHNLFSFPSAGAQVPFQCHEILMLDFKMCEYPHDIVYKIILIKNPMVPPNRFDFKTFFTLPN